MDNGEQQQQQQQQAHPWPQLELRRRQLQQYRHEQLVHVVYDQVTDPGLQAVVDDAVRTITTRPPAEQVQLLENLVANVRAWLRHSARAQAPP
ncbi:hypothetical protein GPECTOR_9g507 [Gonium pectorale]|uniref:Uncharacterized protein n=1 Tax=Gonium pectorale TaxID=33097 RepID=A0A150GRP8_GONPE|nr:hypothetical protein GPECTOR_9g507 [Gonium pectorale]|eukprot:KXZ52463.1 hypothetical protein GPECTOR_9g507 [Gonium pectorale]